MLNLLKRHRRPVTAVDVDNSLAIHDLLDHPDLRALMAIDVDQPQPQPHPGASWTEAPKPGLMRTRLAYAEVAA